VVVVTGNQDWAVIHGPVTFNHFTLEAIEYIQESIVPRLVDLFGGEKERI
jgi:hypothetical protein